MDDGQALGFPGQAPVLARGDLMEFDENMPLRARELTKRFFCDDHNNCAESVFRAIMEVTNQPCSVEVLRLASSFGRGMGHAGCVCGALVGGQMAIGSIFGRKENSGHTPDICGDAAKLLHNRFKKQNGATCCRILHKGQPFGSDEQLEACCARSVDAAELVARVIAEVSANGGVPQRGKILG